MTPEMATAPDSTRTDDVGVRDSRVDLSDSRRELDTPADLLVSRGNDPWDRDAAKTLSFGAALRELGIDGLATATPDRLADLAEVADELAEVARRGLPRGARRG